MMNEREKLIELLLQSELEAEELGIFNCHKSEVKAGIVADFLLENGVIVPPCKVDDTIYYIYFSDDKKEYTVDEFVAEEVSDKKVIVDSGECEIGIEEFGEYAFLSREEAEQAAERLNNEKAG